MLSIHKALIMILRLITILVLMLVLIFKLILTAIRLGTIETAREISIDGCGIDSACMFISVLILISNLTYHILLGKDGMYLILTKE
jgi:hypothetical protein